MKKRKKKERKKEIKKEKKERKKRTKERKKERKERKKDKKYKKNFHVNRQCQGVTFIGNIVERKRERERVTSQSSCLDTSGIRKQKKFLLW